MKRRFLCLLMALVLFTGCGAEREATVQAAPETVETEIAADLQQEEPLQTEAAEEIVPQVQEIEYGSFKLVFGEPSIVVQGRPGDQAWGHFQFPSMYYTQDRNIAINWAYGDDTIRYDGITGVKISTDRGETWENAAGYDRASSSLRMKNGKYFAGFAGKGAYSTDYLDRYEPAVTWDGYNKLYFAEDIEETRDKTILAGEYDPKTGKTEIFEVTVNWPHMPLVQYGAEKLLFPATQMFALSNRSLISIDGELYISLYFHGFDSTAQTREEANYKYSRYYSTYLFKSSDCGRTWDFLSQISVDHETFEHGMEGFCEAQMTVMPDDSVVMLMRSGNITPSYLVRSTDRCKTWSEPQEFDMIGVMPQIATLRCGVTVATYGRPVMRICATDDPTGQKWEEPVSFDLVSGWNNSCYYTDLLILDDHTLLWAYTEFRYPNENGEPVKTVLTRTITVEKKE